METLRERCIVGREVVFSKLLGAGSNGRVYLATPMNQSSASNQFPYPSRFVVKVMQKDVWPTNYVETILKEINAIRMLKHPFIVSYVGAWIEANVGEYSGSVCLAMSYCDGGDLHDLIRDYRKTDEYVSNDLVMMIMLQILSALNHSHAHYIIHRDIKPANLFLVRDASAEGGVEKVLVGDYGLARPIDRTVELAKTRVGTPCYCSPEIVAGEPYTTKTDIFSAGVTFFELMTKERPFWEKGFTDRQSFYRILNMDPMPDLRRVAQGRYDSCLVRAVAACLCKNEKGRPTAFELLTGFASPLTKYVHAKGIPVCSEAAKVSPMRIEGNSPLRRISPVSPVCRTPSRPQMTSRVRKVTPKRVGVMAAAQPMVPAVPAVLAEVAGGAAAEQKQGTPKQNGLTDVERLVQVLENGFADKGECDKLKNLLEGDLEAFLLLQVLLLTRASDKNALENGIFKLLLSLKPQISVERVILWMSARDRTG